MVGRGVLWAGLASYEFLVSRTSWDVDDNYASYAQNSEERRGELERLVEEGHLERIGSCEQVLELWPGAIGTKIDGALASLWICGVRGERRRSVG